MIFLVLSSVKTEENRRILRLIFSKEYSLTTGSIIGGIGIAIRNCWADLAIFCLSRNSVNLVERYWKLTVTQPTNKQEEHNFLEICYVLKEYSYTEWGKGFFDFNSKFYIANLLKRFEYKNSAEFKEMYEYFYDRSCYPSGNENSPIHHGYLDFCYEHLDARLFALIAQRGLEKFL
jgi:hypothetical protein